MLDPKDPKEIRELHEVVEANWDKLEDARCERDQVISDLAGNHFGSDRGTNDKDLPVNFVELALSVYRRELISDNPRVYASTEYSDLKTYTETVEKAINWRIEQMNLKDELVRLATDALVGPLGIMDVGRDVYMTYEHEGQTFRRTRTYTKTIGFENWVHDCDAERWEDMGLCGHLVRMREDAFKDTPLFTKEAKEKVRPVELTRYRKDGTRSVKADGEFDAKSEKYARWIEFWKLWLPREEILVYLPKEMPNGFEKALKVMRWRGPTSGPFHKLGFGMVPNNILQMSPIKDVLLDLNDLLNDVFGKIEDQALRQKKNPIFQSGGEDDFQRLANADDGEAVRMDTQFQELSSGGVDQINLLLFLQVKKLIEYVGGGLPILAGLGPMSPTATQDQLLKAASSKRMADMQSKMTAVVRDICEAIGYYEWHDLKSDPQLVKELPGGVMRKLSFAPEHRRGGYHQDSIKLHPYSLREQSPIERVSQIDQFVQTVLIPMMPIMPQYGMGFDMQKYVDLRARLLNLPELKEVITYVEPDPEQLERGRAGMEQRQAPVTERINTRVNRPSEGMESDDAIMSRLLPGGGGPESMLEMV